MLLGVVGIVSCSRSASHYNRIIDEAECLAQTNIDSAMSMLDAIDPSELRIDSIRIKYHYLKAWGHMLQNRSMVTDSLIYFVHDYYKGKDIVRDMRSGTALAWYKFWVGDTPGAIRLLDSLVNCENVPDTLLAQTLRVRVLLGASEYQGQQLIPLAKKLIQIETDSLRKIEAEYVLISAYEYSDKCDSALMLMDELIDYARAKHWGDKQFQFEHDRTQILAELGRYDESNAVIDEIFRKAPGNGASHYLHLQKAMNLFNMGNNDRAAKELAVADSIAAQCGDNENAYFNRFSSLLRTMMDFKQKGRMTVKHIATINNRQQERLNRMKASQWETERGALQQQTRVLALKAENGHKTVVILIIALFAVVVTVAALWLIRQRRQREYENEERVEALQKMVDELKAVPLPQAHDSKISDSLRHAMLRQLGIIKMVAETPTEQNREMLRKISSIDGETNGGLVNWQNVFEVIDNLYSGFYTQLHERYQDTLNDKEEQIIVLMMAGFSTKEISVITGQTISTIYVRKSSVRKKLGLPEKEDIVTFLRKG